MQAIPYALGQYRGDAAVIGALEAQIFFVVAKVRRHTQSNDGPREVVILKVEAVK